MSETRHWLVVVDMILIAGLLAGSIVNLERGQTVSGISGIVVVIVLLSVLRKDIRRTFLGA